MKTLDQVTADDLRSVGGKTYNCARLKQAGFPVPDGVVVPVDVVEADIRALPADSWFDALPDGARFAVTRLEPHLGPLLLIYPSLWLLVTLLIWLAFFRA